VKLTKHNHACVAFEKEGSSFVIDPGSFSADAAEIIAGAEAILITHEHYDHVHEAAINEALAARPELKVYAPASLAGMFGAHGNQFTAVSAGDDLKIAGFTISVHGSTHAVIHPDIPTIPNVYHPGDAYYVPEVSVSTLLLPTSGPWMKIGEAADYVRAVRPERTVQIHEMILSEIGQNLAATLLGEKGLTGVPLTVIAPGESVTV